MRGIAWQSVPTTLLAAADSCIGGKTAVNSPMAKNLLGTFYPPQAVFITPQFLTTLSDADFLSGVGEMLKIALLSGKEAVDYFEQKLPLLKQRDHNVVSEFIHLSLLYKKNIIEKDEMEQHERKYLNYGHTFGHALEIFSKYEISHGKAVALGMLYINKLAVSAKVLHHENAERVQNLVEAIYGKLATLPSIEHLWPIVKHDKKRVKNTLDAVFINNNFTPVMYPIAVP